MIDTIDLLCSKRSNAELFHGYRKSRHFCQTLRFPGGEVLAFVFLAVEKTDFHRENRTMDFILDLRFVVR